MGLLPWQVGLKPTFSNFLLTTLAYFDLPTKLSIVEVSWLARPLACLVAFAVLLLLRATFGLGEPLAAEF